MNAEMNMATVIIVGNNANSLSSLHALSLFYKDIGFYLLLANRFPCYLINSDFEMIINLDMF